MKNISERVAAWFTHASRSMQSSVSDRIPTRLPRGVSLEQMQAKYVTHHLECTQHRLQSGLELVWSTYQERIADLSERIGLLGTTISTGDVRELQIEQEELGRSVIRLRTALRDTESLLREWNEREVAHQQGWNNDTDPDQEVSHECIRSELMMRGMLPVAEQDTVFPRTSASDEDSVIVLASSYAESRDELDELDAWNAVMPARIERSVQFWEDRVRHLSSFFPVDSVACAEALRSLRQAHASLKQFDRAQGIERHRTQMFDVAEVF